MIKAKLIAIDPDKEELVYDIEVADNHNLIADRVLVSNCHHVKNSGPNPINTWFNLALMSDAYYRFGFSATPGNEGELSRGLLESATGKMIYDIPIQRLIEEKFIATAQVDIHRVVHNRKYSSSNWSEAESEGIVDNIRRNITIANLVNNTYAKLGTVFISCNKIKQGRTLSSLIPNSVFLCGQDDSDFRASTLKDFSEGKLKVLVSTLLREGVDIPSMRVMVRASGGKTEIGTTQTGNRVLTIDEFKKAGTIVDFLDEDGGILKKHSKARLKVYEDQGFPVEVIDEQ